MTHRPIHPVCPIRSIRPIDFAKITVLAAMLTAMIGTVTWFPLPAIAQTQAQTPASEHLAALHQPELHEAAMAGDAAEVSRLLAAGAPPDAVDADGVTPLMLAATGPDPLVRELAKAGFGKDVRGNIRRMKRAIHGSLETVRVLIDGGADVNAATPRGITALALAVAGEELPVVQALLEAGAAVDQQAKRGETALMVAAAAGNTITASLLLAAGADPGLKTRDGLTASVIALLAGNLETARAIASAGNR